MVKKILSFVLTLVMVISVIGVIPAKAATTYSGSVTLEGNQYANNINVIRDKRGMYLRGSDGLNDLQSSWDITYTAPDAASGIFLDEKKVSGGCIKKYEGNYWYMSGWGESISEGQTITIKGDFVSGDTTITLEEANFIWDGTRFAVAKGEADKSFVDLQVRSSGTTNDDGTVNGLYVYTTEKGTRVNDGMPYNGDWSVKATPKLATYSGILVNGAFHLNQMVKLEGDVYYVDLAGNGVTIGDTVTVQGQFTYGDYVVDFNTHEFTWDGQNWTGQKILSSGELQVYGNELRGANSSLAAIYAKGDSVLDRVYKNGVSEGDNWNETLTGVTNADGVFLNGSKVSDASIKKYNDSANRWHIGGLGSTKVVGDVVTVKGRFALPNGAEMIHIKPSSFKWTGTVWVKVFEEGKLSLEGAEDSGGGNSKKAIYLKGDDVLTNYLIGSNNNWTNYLQGVTDEDGIFLNGTKLTSATLFKYNDSRNFWYAQGFEATEGSIVTIKGNFAPAANSGGEYQVYTGNVVHVAKVSFKWDGSAWSLYEKDTYHDICLTGFTRDSQYNNAVGWQGYFTTNAQELPGTAWSDAYSLKATIDDGEEFTVIAKKSSTANVLYMEIPSSKLPLMNTTAKVTIKAGKYKSSLGDVGCAIVEDYTFYVNQYAWSESKIASATSMSPEFRWNERNASNSKNGFVLSVKADDGTKYNPENEWDISARLYPLPASKTFVNDTMYFASSGNGLYKDGVCVGNIHMQKMNAKTYYVSLVEYGYGETQGVAGSSKYQIKGYFYDGNGKVVYYETGYLKWNGSTWEVSSVNLTDSGVDGDVNADSFLNVADLVRLLRRQDNGMVAMNEAREDVNYDGNKDKRDIDALRKVLVGAIYYRGDEAFPSVPYGLPIVDDSKRIDKLAYACPEVATWTGTKYASGSTVEVKSDAEIDELFREYKKTGFNMLITEFVAPLTTYEYTHPFNDPLRAYLNGAARNGLDVIVSSDYLNSLLRADASAFEEGGDYANWKNVMAGYIQYLRNFSAFKGFQMADELNFNRAANYQMVASWMTENYPELIQFSSQLPNYGEDSRSGATFTEATYKEYIDAFGPYSGYFTYDNYGLSSKTTDLSIFGTTTDYYVDNTWYTNLKWVAENSVNSDGTQKYIPGITIQSFSMAAGSSGWRTYARYAPVETADIGFQVYTSLAWGMQSINYFSYADHYMDPVVEEEIQVNPSVKAAVTAVNAEINKFQSVYKGFTWKQTLDLLGTTNSSTGNERLASATVSGARTLIGCMKDADGFDGYMIANAAGPRTETAATVTLKFRNATSAVVYEDGEKKIVNLTDGQCTLLVNVGEGVFVIPIR